MSAEIATPGTTDWGFEEVEIVRTSSRMRAWYLTRFCGLHVRAVRCTPNVTFFGLLVYARCWVLAGS